MHPSRTWLVAATLGALLCLVCGKGQDTHNPLEKIKTRATATRLDPRIQIKLNSTVLEHTGQWFTVSWSNVPSPGYGDWLALMVPAGAEPSETTPAKYKIAASSRTHLTHGEGSLTFRLINYRHDMQFVFMRGGMMLPVVAAYSPVIKVANPNEPLHGHLALTGVNTEMSVQWASLNSKSPTVQWGSQPGVYTDSTPATSHTYTQEEMCGGPANSTGWLNPGTMHAAVLKGLVPGQRYYYRYGSEIDGGFSTEASFRAAPPVGPETRVKLLAVADLGQAEVDGSMEISEMNPSLNTTRLLNQEGDDYQLLMHNGDISYARGFVTQWDNYMHQMEPIVRRMPYMVCPGNHERDWPDSGDRFPPQCFDSGGECGVAYEARLKMPQPSPGQQWYSFDFGPIHFLQYSTEQPFAPGDPQHDFILEDLAKLDRAKTPWLIVGGHRPMYISSNNVLQPDGDQPVAAEIREALEDVFYKYKVDMTWHGHHHSYQRTCPMYRGRCRREADRHGASAAAPVHLVIGNAGADLSLNTELWPGEIWEKIKLWWGYMRVEASGTELKCEVISDLDGSVMDTITLVKPKGWGEAWMAAQQRQQQQQQEGGGMAAAHEVTPAVDTDEGSRWFQQS